MGELGHQGCEPSMDVAQEWEAGDVRRDMWARIVDWNARDIEDVCWRSNASHGGGMQQGTAQQNGMLQQGAMQGGMQGGIASDLQKKMYGGNANIMNSVDDRGVPTYAPIMATNGADMIATNPMNLNTLGSLPSGFVTRGQVDGLPQLPPGYHDSVEAKSGGAASAPYSGQGTPYEGAGGITQNSTPATGPQYNVQTTPYELQSEATQYVPSTSGAHSRYTSGVGSRQETASLPASEYRAANIMETNMVRAESLYGRQMGLQPTPRSDAPTVFEYMERSSARESLPSGEVGNVMGLLGGATEGAGAPAATPAAGAGPTAVDAPRSDEGHGVASLPAGDTPSTIKTPQQPSINVDTLPPGPPAAVDMAYVHATTQSNRDAQTSTRELDSPRAARPRASQRRGTGYVPAQEVPSDHEIDRAIDTTQLETRTSHAWIPFETLWYRVLAWRAYATDAELLGRAFDEAAGGGGSLTWTAFSAAAARFGVRARTRRALFAAASPVTVDSWCAALFAARRRKHKISSKEEWLLSCDLPRGSTGELLEPTLARNVAKLQGALVDLGFRGKPRLFGQSKHPSKKRIKDLHLYWTCPEQATIKQIADAAWRQLHLQCVWLARGGASIDLGSLCADARALAEPAAAPARLTRRATQDARRARRALALRPAEPLSFPDFCRAARAGLFPGVHLLLTTKKDIVQSVVDQVTADSIAFTKGLEGAMSDDTHVGRHSDVGGRHSEGGRNSDGGAQSDGINIRRHSDATQVRAHLPQELEMEEYGDVGEYVRQVRALQCAPWQQLVAESRAEYARLDRGSALRGPAEVRALATRLLEAVRMGARAALPPSDVFALCDAARGALAPEPALVLQAAHTRVLGNLEGSLTDLRTYFNELGWPYRVGPGGLEWASDTLTLAGNAVGEEPTSLDVILWFFALKVLFPDKVALLRGGNETLWGSVRCGLLGECLAKYGSKDVRPLWGGPGVGTPVWYKLNDVFNYMSIACVADKLFIMHGLVDAEEGALEGLASLEKPIVLDEQGCPVVEGLACQTLQLCLFGKLTRVPEPRLYERGTEAWLTAARCDRLVSANGRPPDGYERCFDGRVYNLSSHVGEGADGASLRVVPGVAGPHFVWDCLTKRGGGAARQRVTRLNVRDESPKEARPDLGEMPPARQADHAAPENAHGAPPTSYYHYQVIEGEPAGEPRDQIHGEAAGDPQGDAAGDAGGEPQSEAALHAVSQITGPRSTHGLRPMQAYAWEGAWGVEQGASTPGIPSVVIPGEAVVGGVTPVGRTPMAGTPGGQTPSDNVSPQYLSGHNTPGMATPGAHTPGENTPGEATPGQNPTNLIPIVRKIVLPPAPPINDMHMEALESGPRFLQQELLAALHESRTPSIDATEIPNTRDFGAIFRDTLHEVLDEGAAHQAPSALALHVRAPQQEPSQPSLQSQLNASLIEVLRERAEKAPHLESKLSGLQERVADVARSVDDVRSEQAVLKASLEGVARQVATRVPPLAGSLYAAPSVSERWSDASSRPVSAQSAERSERDFAAPPVPDALPVERTYKPNIINATLTQFPARV